MHFTIHNHTYTVAFHLQIHLRISIIHYLLRSFEDVVKIKKSLCIALTLIALKSTYSDRFYYCVVCYRVLLAWLALLISFSIM